MVDSISWDLPVIVCGGSGRFVPCGDAWAATLTGGTAIRRCSWFGCQIHSTQSRHGYNPFRRLGAVANSNRLWFSYIFTLFVHGPCLGAFTAKPGRKKKVGISNWRQDFHHLRHVLTIRSHLLLCREGGVDKGKDVGSQLVDCSLFLALVRKLVFVLLLTTTWGSPEVLCKQPAKHKQLLFLKFGGFVQSWSKIIWSYQHSFGSQFKYRTETDGIFTVELLAVACHVTFLQFIGRSWRTSCTIQCILDLRVGWWETFANLVEVDPIWVRGRAAWSPFPRR